MSGPVEAAGRGERSPGPASVAAADSIARLRGLAQAHAAATRPLRAHLPAPNRIRHARPPAGAPQCPQEPALRPAQRDRGDELLLVLERPEIPLPAGHLENLLRLARLGAIIAPPVPAFYIRPKSVDDLVDHAIGRVLDSSTSTPPSPPLGRGGELSPLLIGKTRAGSDRARAVQELIRLIT